MPGREIVQNHYFVALAQELLGRNAADIAGTAGYQNVHCRKFSDYS